MPRYFMQFENGHGLEQDDTGQDLASDDAAIAEAGRTLGGVLSDEISEGRTSLAMCIRIEREAGACVATIRAHATVERA